MPVGIVADLFVPVEDGRVRLLSCEELGEGFCDRGSSFEGSSGNFWRFALPSGAHTLASERSASQERVAPTQFVV